MDGQVDYSKYDEVGLLQVFQIIDPQKYPINYSRMKSRLEALGYEVIDSGKNPILKAPPEAAIRAAEREQARVAERQRIVTHPRFRIGCSLLIASLCSLIFGLFRMEFGTGDFGPIGEGFVFAILGIVLGGAGTVQLYVASSKPEPSTLKLVGALIGGLAITAIVFIPVSMVTLKLLEVLRHY
jgi:hypothetical protein